MANGACMTLSARWWPVVSCTASNTTPMPPSPSLRMTRKSSPMTVSSSRCVASPMGDPVTLALIGLDCQAPSYTREMDRPRPACPICGATDERPPDALGVHRCPACAIEFRPPGRMPIRLATVSPGVQPNHDFRTLIYAMAIVGASLGIAVAVGDHKAGAPPPTL